MKKHDHWQAGDFDFAPGGGGSWWLCKPKGYGAWSDVPPKYRGRGAKKIDALADLTQKLLNRIQEEQDV